MQGNADIWSVLFRIFDVLCLGYNDADMPP